MEFSAPITLVTVSGNVAINDGNTFWATALEGFDDAELRVTLDPKAGADGNVVHAIYKGAIFGTITGYIKVSSVSARNTAEHLLRDYVSSIRTADGQFQITETGMSMKYLVVRQYMPTRFTPIDGIVHEFTVSLVAADPTWH